MLRLTLWNFAETAQHNIELYENAPVNLNYQFADITEINKTKGSYTQTFRIPATKVNTDFFGALSDPAVQTSSALIIGNFNIKRKIRADLNYNSVPLMSGYVQIKAIYKQKKDFADIELVFFGETIDMASKVGDSMLTDLTSTALDHTLNLSNIQASWLTLLASGNVRYGMMDKGQNWTFADTANPAWSATNGVWQGDLTPYVRAKWIIDEILNEAGYSYTSTFLGTADFENIYLPAYNGVMSPISDDYEPEGETAAAGLSSGMSLGLSFVLIQFKDTAAGGWDYGSNWNNTAYSYTAPYPCEITFTLSQRSDDTTSQAWIRVYKNGTYITGLEYVGNYSNTFDLLLYTGDVITFKVRQLAGTGDNLISGPIGSENTWVRVDFISEPLMLQDIDMVANFPKIKQIDFLTSIQKMFNLVFIPDKNKPQHLIIEPFNDYTATGTAKDWTNKVDYKKDVVIKPTTDIQRKDYAWTYDEGQDFINIFIQQGVGRTYGRHKVTDPDNAFAVGSETITTKIAPYLMSHVPNSAFIIHRCIDADGVGVKAPKPRLAYWNGLTSNYGTWYIRNDVATTLSVATFPQFSNYSAVAPTIDDNNLNFGTELDFFFTEANALHTLYYKYWSNYVNQLYSKDSRILDLYIQLNNADIQAFEYSDRLYIEDTYYRILKISNYDATQGGSTKVTLIKIVQDVADCEFIPKSVVDGIIRFEGLGIVYGNQTCCEQYGYTWRPRVSRCYANNTTLIPTVI